MPILTNQVSRFIGGGRVPPTPSQITGLALWLKADAITGLADGDAIGTWTDSSGNGRNATQATAGAKPTYKTGIINSLPVARFDGGDALLLGDILDSIFAGANRYHIFAVAKSTAMATGEIIAKVGDSSQSENARQFGLFFRVTGKIGTYHSYDAAGNNVTIVNSATSYTAGAFIIIAASYDGAVGSGSANSTARVQMTVNGAAQTETVEVALGNFGNVQDTTAQLSIGAHVGTAGTVPAAPLTGDIAEIIIYDSALSDANRQQVEQYLAWKYAITLA